MKKKSLSMKDNIGDRARILHIRDAIEEIKSYVKECDFNTFEDNSMMHNACIKQLEIIGEAANRISDELKDISPELKKRMQGKSCFNFKSIDEARVKELINLTKKGFEYYKKEGML